MLLLLLLLSTILPSTTSKALPPESQQWLDETEYASTNLKSLNTRITIDGEEYKPICKCIVPPADHSIQCYPTQIQIQRQPPMLGTLQPGRLIIDGSNLRKLIGDPADLRLVDATQSSFHDIDGRSSEESVRVWGGEAGQLLLALAVWDDMTLASTGAPLRYTSVKNAVEKWIKYENAINFRKYFYLNTDTDAVAFVENQISKSNHPNSNSDEPLDITLPPEIMQDAVLKALITPNGTGCPHLKAILTHPEKYNIRLQLVEEFITHVYRFMWDMNEPLRKKIKLYIYHAPYVGQTQTQPALQLPREAAWINLISDATCWNEKKVAIFPPWSEDVSVFIYQPQAVKELHKSTARFIKGMMGGAGSTGEILPKLEEKYEVWDVQTKSTLKTMQGIPVFDVTIGVGENMGVVEEEGEGEVKKKKGIDVNMFKEVPLEGEE